jgi:transcriptional regulator with XRE-family HTH domain
MDESIGLKEHHAFVERMKTLLRQTGLPWYGAQARMAEITELSPKAVSKWFTEHTYPSRQSAHLLAKHFGVTPGWILFGDETGQREEADRGEEDFEELADQAKSIGFSYSNARYLREICDDAVGELKASVETTFSTQNKNGVKTKRLTISIEIVDDSK